MLFSIVITLCFVFAAPVFGILSTTTTNVCFTSYATKYTKSVSSTTRTKRSTSTITRAVISFSTTITPSPVTRTRVVDSIILNTITAAQETGIYTETIWTDEIATVTSTSTITSSATEFETSTQELEEVLTTYSTLAGFLPIQSDPTNQPLRKRSQQRSEFNHEKPFPAKPRRYPAYVSCNHVIRVYTTKFGTSSASKLIIITVETPTITTTSTSTYTSKTYAIPPAGWTTVTESATSTISTTEIVSETSTSTTTETQVYIARPASTIFPACSPNNMLSSHGGNQIIYGQQLPGATKFSVFHSVPDVSTPEQCCQICQLEGDCAGFFHGGYDGRGCVLARVNTCAPDEVVAQYVTTSGSPDARGYVVGNGNCGRMQWYASD